MTDIPHGPVTAEMLPLLTPGRSVLLCKPWGLMVFDRFDDSERRAFMFGLCDGQVRLLLPADKMTYIGERDDDGWISAPKGGWKSNPAPGVGGYVRFYDEGGGEIHSYTRWDDVVAFRPATPPAPADGLADKLARYLAPLDFEVRRRSSRNQHAANLSRAQAMKTAKRVLRFRPIADALAAAAPPAPANGLEVVATVVSAHGDPEAFGERLIGPNINLSCVAYNSPLVLKSAADAQAAELRAEIERLRGIVRIADELVNGGGLINRGVDRGLVVVEKADNSDPHYRLCKALELLTKIGEPR